MSDYYIQSVIFYHVGNEYIYSYTKTQQNKLTLTNKNNISV